jgi:cellulose synthase operon protein C
MATGKLLTRVFLALAALALVLSVSACSSMEEKRDRAMAQGMAAFEQGEFTSANVHFKNALQLDPQLAEGYLWLAKTELRLNNVRQAFGALSKAVELDPELSEAQVNLGNFFLLGKRVDEAEAKAELVLAKEPDNTEALMLAAGVALAREQPDKAMEIVTRVRELDASKVIAYLTQAQIENLQERPEAAARTLEEGIQANPQATALYFARARLAEQQGQLDQAEAYLKKVEEIAPADIGLQNELIRLHLLKRQWDQAETGMRRRLALEPENEAHAAALARFMADRGRFAEGEKLLQDFMTRHPQKVEPKFALADFYLNQRKFGRAERLLQEIARGEATAPSSIRAKGLLAVVALNRGRQEEAGRLVAEVLQHNPTDMTALRVQGLLALAEKDHLKAVTNFRILTQDQPENHENWLLLSRAHLANNEPLLAREAAKRALAVKPDYLEARSALYNMYLQAKEYDGLIRLIKDYLHANDQDVTNWGALGDVYVLKGDDKEAEAAYQQMISLEPKNPQGYLKLALLSRKQQQPEQVIRHLEQALRENPVALPALRLLVGLHLEQKQPAKAEEAVRASLDVAPKHAALHQLLGEVHLAQNQPATAVQALEQSLTLNPNNPPALGLLIRAYDGLPDREGIRQRLTEKAKDRQAHVFYGLALAQLYEYQQQGDQAIDVYEILLARGVASTLVQNNLAFLLAEHRPTAENLARGEKMLLALLDDHPDDPSLLDTMGWILCRQGKYVQAKTYLDQAATRVPGNPVVQFHLGYCLAQLGDKEAARTALKKALAAEQPFSQREEAQKLLESLKAS